MGISRYAFSRKILKGRYFGTSTVSTRIRNAVESGLVTCNHGILAQGQRLDQLSGAVYGDSSFWWVIAAASGIGWGLQVPPGTRLKIPTSLNEVLDVL